MEFYHEESSDNSKHINDIKDDFLKLKRQPIAKNKNVLVQLTEE